MDGVIAPASEIGRESLGGVQESAPPGVRVLPPVVALVVELAVVRVAGLESESLFANVEIVRGFDGVELDERERKRERERERDISEP